jgi:cell division protein FtsZ
MREEETKRIQLFHNNVSKIDEYERAAYKRLGIEISNTQSDNTNSRISVGTDSNNELHAF